MEPKGSGDVLHMKDTFLGSHTHFLYPNILASTISVLTTYDASTFVYKVSNEERDASLQSGSQIEFISFSFFGSCF